MRSDINFTNADNLSNDLPNGLPNTVEAARQQLEQLLDAQPNASTGLGHALKQVGTRVMAWLVADSQPQIHTRMNHLGQCQWRVYDPVSQRKLRFESEEALRIWLEQRYYD